MVSKKLFFINFIIKLKKMNYDTKLHRELVKTFNDYLKEEEKINKGFHQAVIRARKDLAKLTHLIKDRREELIEDYNLENL